jgi:hypothetical protein
VFNPDSHNVVTLYFRDADKSVPDKTYRALLGKQEGVDNSRRMRITMQRELLLMYLDGLLWQLENGEGDTVSIDCNFGGMELIEDEENAGG